MRPAPHRPALRAALALSLSGALLAPGSLRAQAAAAEAGASRARLEQIQRERGALRSEISEIRNRARSLSGELNALKQQSGNSAELLGELDFQLGERSVQVDRNARELLATRDQLGDRRAVLHRRLRDIYKRGALHPVQVILTAESFGDLINRYKYLFLIARHDRLLVREVAALEMELTARERLLERTIAELSDIRSERSLEHDEIDRLRQRKQQVLEAVARRERTAAARLAKLEEDERSVRSLLAALERSRKASAAAAPATRATAGSLTAGDRGGLGWPVRGDLLYRFGRARQDNGTTIRWNGVGIGAAAGAPVQAVEEGTVVLAGPFEGYGPTVILSHGGGYYSLYLYLRDLAVQKGQRVTRSQTVGTVGGTDTPEGSHVEFQIRAPGGEAVDPLLWLQQRQGE